VVVVLVDPVVLVTEVDVLAGVVGPDEHPAMTTAMTTADRMAADLINIVLAGVTGGVTLPLLPSAGSGGGCPVARWSTKERSTQKGMMRDERHPERHPPKPE
jgi:hypothetical protein